MHRNIRTIKQHHWQPRFNAWILIGAREREKERDSEALKRMPAGTTAEQKKKSMFIESLKIQPLKKVSRTRHKNAKLGATRRKLFPSWCRTRLECSRASVARAGRLPY